MNGCFTHTSVGVCERLLRVYTYWLYEWLLYMYICWCIWMAASHAHLLVYVNGCFLMYVCWCIWMAVSQARLLVYVNGCLTHTFVGAYEWLFHMYICWCIWTAALHVHLLLTLGTIKVSPHTLCHHKIYGLQNIIIHLVLSQTLYGTCSITTHYFHKGFVWTIIYHHTSSIITNSCMYYTVSPHIKYHRKVFVWTIQ